MTPTPQDGPDTATRGDSVTPEQFARVRAIFEAALERPARDRRGFVDGACGGDEALRREVEAMLAADAASAPLLDRPPSTPPSSAPDEGRFPAGTVLAGRYRILGLLGTGGMGEVYRAHDLILNQTVALKFLAPAHISEAALIRFRNEVRVARQVSHPSVCRVYDLGMVEGLHFLSMEYIDGEDLASLLRRIGRLPQDKAIEFTRKICAGLSAAHERGVLHRDLKPANIMIDGRGQPRITDFGLAGLAAEIPLSDLRSGTPAYMAPEQKAGKEVTVRSDLYALGLVLHEMFTGKARQDTQSSPTALVKDLDPAIERLILRCLEEEPKRRPSSAMQVAMALPGGDPIAAALAAGETPSPEMVAASQEKEGFSPRTAILCFAAVVITLAAGVWLARSLDFTTRAPLPLPPAALADRAGQLLRSVGYAETPQATAYGFTCCDARLGDHLAGHTRAERDELLASHQPPAIAFWYREHRHGFGAGDGVYGRVTEQSPPTYEPGMRLVRLDATGRLLRVHVEPWIDEPGGGPVDWLALFAAAGLDLARFSEASPRGFPPMMADDRRSWTGSYADGRTEVVRVDAASLQGRIVWFDAQGLPVRESPPDSPMAAVSAVMRVVLLAVVPLMAWRNWRLRRVDARGATQLAGVSVLGMGGLESFLLPVMTWLMYVAVEPHTRRYWPDSLIAWSRLSRGGFRNPLVASHVLSGLVVGVAFSVIAWPVLTALTLHMPNYYQQQMLSGSPGSWDQALLLLGQGPGYALQFLFAIVLARLMAGNVWLADILAVAFINLWAMPDTFGGSALLTALMMGPGLAWIWIMRRFGFLAMLSVWTVSIPLMVAPHHLSGWLGERLLFWHLVPVVVAAWAVWVILSAPQRSTATDAAR